MAKNTYKVKFVKGVLKIIPNIITTKNEKGGQDVKIQALDPTTEARVKQEIINKIAAGVPIEGLEF